jgi:hypothetical protein
MEAVLLTVVVVVCVVLMMRSLARKVSPKDGGGCGSCTQGDSCRGKK